MRENVMDIWSWDGGFGLGWFSTKMGEVEQVVDNSLSREMEKLNLRNLWEKPVDTLKTASDRFCDACSKATGLCKLAESISEQRAAIKRKLNDWINSIEVAVHSQYKLLERTLNEESKSLLELNPQPSTNEHTNSHLISLGYVKRMPIASRSSVICDDLDTIQNVVRTVPLHVCDFEGEPCNLIDRHMELRTVLVYDDGEEVDISVSRAVGIGDYNLCFRAMRPGRATLSVKLHGVDVAQSPRKIVIFPTRLWASGDLAASFFGKQGADKGHFQRPWGVGCDRKGRILVADRSNNRVQVFRDDGTFLFEFGKKGTGPGEFQLVSAVAGAPNGDLICVDKDNHRIQVFSEQGRFKYAFGKLGEKPGEFHYPWDVDVNARGEIVVTDSRNSRIQLFDPSGKFVKALERVDCPNMELPRGVSFINTNEVVVSDFDKHVLIIFNLRTKTHKLICKEGSEAGQLKRPQGVAWHPQGFIVVGDSRNNRIQAVDLNGSMVWEFGAKLSHEDQLDRPCGVAVTKKGSIVAIDFGNNRAFALH